MEAGAACSPQISSLGTLTTSSSEAAGAAGRVGEGVGSAGASSSAGTAGTGTAIGPFGPPRLIPTLSSAGMVTTDPCVTGDRLTMYMMSTRGGSKDLFVSTRSSIGDEWGTPLPVTELNTSDHAEQNCKFLPDGLTLFFYSDRERTLGTLWEAHRASTAEAWAVPTVIPGICDTSASDIASAQSANQLVVVFTSLRSHQTQGYDLFEARRSSSSVSFESPTLIAEVNSPEDDFDPYLSPEGTVLLFHSMRSGNEDIYWARRDTLESHFSAPLPVSEINSTASDVAADLAADGSAIWFASTRDGDEQIYEATVTQK